MLRISASEAAGDSVTLQLDGQITGRWVMLLQGMCEAHLQKGLRLVMDLRNVSFADRDGAALLQNLQDRQVEFRNALPFIAEQMRKTKP